MIDALAAGALCGVPIERIVAGDEIERVLWLEVIERATAMRVQLIKAQASYNANAVARLFKRG